MALYSKLIGWIITKLHQWNQGMKSSSFELTIGHPSRQLDFLIVTTTPSEPKMVEIWGFHQMVQLSIFPRNFTILHPNIKIMTFEKPFRNHLKHKSANYF